MTYQFHFDPFSLLGSFDPLRLLGRGRLVDVGLLMERVEGVPTEKALSQAVQPLDDKHPDRGTCLARRPTPHADCHYSETTSVRHRSWNHDDEDTTKLSIVKISESAK